MLLDQNMSVKILVESTISREKTVVYQALCENFVVINQQKKVGEGWTFCQKFLSIAKLFIKAIAALPNKTEPSEGSVITSDGILPSKTTPSFEHHDVDKLTDEVKRIFYRYYCECILLLEHQLGVNQACDDLADMWRLKSTPESPDSHTPLSEPATEPRALITPSPSPSLFAGLTQQRQFSVCNGDQPFDCNILSGKNFQTPQQSNESQFETPQRSETPQFAPAPKKRKPEQSLMDFAIARTSTNVCHQYSS